MKRILLFAAVSVALTGCVNDETESFDATPSNKKITFEAPFLGKVATRAAENAKYPDDQSFKVWGWYHEGDYNTFQANDNKWQNWMDAEGKAVEVSKDPTNNWWKSSDAYYWPKSENGKLTFAAYSPANLTATKIEHTATGLQIEGFTVPTEANVDVMYSDRTYNQTVSNNDDNTSTTPSYTGVQIHFHHALSNICFTAKTEADYSKTMKIKITSIKVSDVNNKGTFNQTIKTDGGNECTPVWNGSVEGTNEYSVYDETDGMEVTSSEYSLTKKLILLPQKFSTGSKGKVTIDYTMNDVACSANIEFNKEGYPDEWKPGYRYTYNIIIGLTEIHFAPYVTEWEDETGTDIKL